MASSRRGPRRRSRARALARRSWARDRHRPRPERRRSAMFVTKKHLTRRTVLRGVGATLALPLLDAMVPAFASTPSKPLVRMGFVYFPHGAVMSKWTPDAEGKSFELAPILAPLEPFKKQLT